MPRIYTFFRWHVAGTRKEFLIGISEEHNDAQTLRDLEEFLDETMRVCPEVYRFSSSAHGTATQLRWLADEASHASFDEQQRTPALLLLDQCIRDKLVRAAAFVTPTVEHLCCLFSPHDAPFCPRKEPCQLCVAVTVKTPC